MASLVMDSEYARDEGALTAFSESVAWAFGGKPADALKWLERTGREHVRVVPSASGVSAGLVEVPMGQWFGGASVPCLGIAGVAVSPAERGAGLARKLLSETLLEARARGVALSCLYPAALRLYRSVGYELAGSRFRYSVRARDLPGDKSKLELVPLEQARTPEVAIHCYRQLARESPGWLDRGAYVWSRVRAPGGEAARGFAVLGDRGPEGYVYLIQKTNDGKAHDLALTDFVALTPRAARRLLGFLGDHRSTVDKVTWCGGPVAASPFAFPERNFDVSLTDYWMLRLVHVERALAARGYPPLTLTLQLEIDDAELPDNAGRYRLSLDAGRVRIERGSGSGAVVVQAGALAALYSGFLSARQLERAGQLKGPPAALDQLSAAFAGPAPGMSDFF